MDEIQLDSSTEEQKLVLHCELSEGLGVFAKVSESLVIGSLEQFDKIEDAQVAISTPDMIEPVALIYDENTGDYVSSFFEIVEGKTYAVTASLPDMDHEDIEAQVTIPSSEEIRILDLQSVDVNFYTVRLEFDLNNEMNFYQIIPKANVYNFSGSGSNILYEHNDKLLTLDLVEGANFDEAIHELEHKDGFLVNEALLEDNILDLTFQLTGGQLEADEIIRYLNLEVRTTSSSYYNYHKAVSKQLFSGQNPTVSEPSLSYTNVQNGYGFLGAFSTKQDSLQIN